jgi:O-antigen/teichoic acid export membrane protein
MALEGNIMRSKNAIRNSLLSLIFSILTIALGLVSQKVFISTLGSTYLGLNGLFSNLLSLLGLAELGLGSVMYYQLYRPARNDNKERIKSLLYFYRKAYLRISLAVMLLAVLIVPFIHFLVPKNELSVNIYLIYGLFLADTIASYVLVYKRALLYANQKNYLIDMLHMGYLVLLNISQILILLITKNFYLYLAIKIVFRLIENFALNILTTKLYPFIKDKNFKKLDKRTISSIYKQIRGLAYHKVGSYIVLSTDNIVISIFLGLSAVGLYTNYFLVISALLLVFGQASAAVTSSVGNMMVKTSVSKSKNVYDKISFANLALSTFVATSFLVLMNGFITVWLGEKYLLSNAVLYVLAFNLFLTLLRSPIMSFKDASGIFHEDRLMPIAESTINLVFSILLVRLIGLPGVFIGTAFSILFLHLYSYPRYVHTALFKSSYKDYYLEFFKKLAIGLSAGIITCLISRTLILSNKFYQFGFNAAICILIPAIIIYVIYRKHDNYVYFKDLLKNLLGSMGKKLLWER